MNKLKHGGDIYSVPNEKIIDFSSNINFLGMPDSVKKAIVDNIELYSNYPDPLCRELVEAISKNENIDSNKIVCGNGAADIIFRICLCLKPKTAIVIAPTFSEYEIALNQVDCHVSHFFLSYEKGFCLDESFLEVINENIEIIFICNPNNPTGIPVNLELMIRIAKKCKQTNTILVIDECFNDFLEDAENFSIISSVNDFENIIILKAFTKIYAMAGIRLGYCVCGSEKIRNKILNTLQPWSVSIVASKCGVVALKENDFVKETKKIVKKNREFLKLELKKLGFYVFDSKANYVFFKSNFTELDEKLKVYDILIRNCSNYIGLGEKYFRIAVKNHENNIFLIESIKKILGEVF